MDIHAPQPDLEIREILTNLRLNTQNFNELTDQVIVWANKSDDETDGATLILIIKLIFQEASDDAASSETYAQLCRKVIDIMSPNVSVESVQYSSGQPITGGQLFRKFLLDGALENFRNMQHHAERQAEDESKPDECVAAEKARLHSLGVVKFLGELFKLRILTERIMHDCFRLLVADLENIRELDVECLCCLLRAAGPLMDTERARHPMNDCFGRIAVLVEDPRLSRRVRLMARNVIALRENQWQPCGRVSPSMLD